jgi:hypothetical protein
MDSEIITHPEILRLIRLSDASRACLSAEAAILRRRLDVPSRIRESLKKHPSAWLLGSLGSGLAASLLLRRKPATTHKNHRGIKSTLLGLAFTAASPLLKAWLLGQVKNRLSGLVRIPDISFPPLTTASPKIKTR